MISVKATREGLIGGRTYTGYRVDPYVPFVALPSTAAVRLWVTVVNPLTTQKCRALVLDVGPWEELDHGYVFQPLTMGGSGPAIRPKAESGTDSRGRTTNGAGIDLGEAVWTSLGMLDNTNVYWEFV